MSRITPASITAMTVTAITTPDVLLIQGFAAVESSSEHSFAQIFTVMVCPLFSINGEIPLALICATNCLALLPFRLALKVPINFEVERQLIMGFSN